MANNCDLKLKELRTAAIMEYEKTLETARAEAVRWKQHRERHESALRHALRASGITLDGLDALDPAQENESATYLSKLRASLVNRPLPEAAADNERIAVATLTGMPGIVSARPYGALVLAASPSLLDGIPGERGNPWVLPYDPRQVDLKLIDRGTGWGWWAEGVPSTQLHMDYFFTPDGTATWDLITLTAVHGFYIVYANDGPWTSKSAEARVTLSINAHQYYWHPGASRPLLSIGGSNIDRWGDLDLGQFLGCDIPLKAGDPVMVRVTLTLEANGKGSGSYAELNFADGAANFIQPLLLAARALF